MYSGASPMSSLKNVLAYDTFFCHGDTPSQVGQGVYFCQYLSRLPLLPELILVLTDSGLLLKTSEASESSLWYIKSS